MVRLECCSRCWYLVICNFRQQCIGVVLSCCWNNCLICCCECFMQWVSCFWLSGFLIFVVIRLIILCSGLFIFLCRVGCICWQCDFLKVRIFIIVFIRLCLWCWVIYFSVRLKVLVGLVVVRWLWLIIQLLLVIWLLWVILVRVVWCLGWMQQWQLFSRLVLLRNQVLFYSLVRVMLCDVMFCNVFCSVVDECRGVCKLLQIISRLSFCSVVEVSVRFGQISNLRLLVIGLLFRLKLFIVKDLLWIRLVVIRVFSVWVKVGREKCLSSRKFICVCVEFFFLVLVNLRFCFCRVVLKCFFFIDLCFLFFLFLVSGL